MTWFTATIVFLQQRNVGTFVLYNSGVGLCFDFEKKKQFTEPDVIHSELKSALGDSWRPDEHHVLAIGLLQFLGHKWPR